MLLLSIRLFRRFLRSKSGVYTWIGVVVDLIHRLDTLYKMYDMTLEQISSHGLKVEPKVMILCSSPTPIRYRLIK